MTSRTVPRLPVALRDPAHRARFAVPTGVARETRRTRRAGRLALNRGER